MHCASALSEHPLATHAVGECVGRLLEAGGERPDLLAVFATQAQLGVLEDIVSTSRQLLRPAATIGAGLESVLAGSREVERHGALTMFALWGGGPGADRRIRPIRLRTSGSPDGPELLGGASLAGATGALLLLTDPFSSPSEAVIGQLDRIAPELRVIGGGASAGRGPGGNVLLLDDEVHRDGAVGVHLPESMPVRSVVARGSRPVGGTFTVTGTHGTLLTGLGGRPALDRLEELVSTMAPEEQHQAVRNLHLGLILDERDDDGPVRVLQLLGIDRERRALGVAGEVELGASVRFELGSPEAAAEELRLRLRDRHGFGGLAFGCTGRGHSWSGHPDHDASIVAEELGTPVAGGFFAGQLAPLAGRTFEHRGSVVVALFG